MKKLVEEYGNNRIIVAIDHLKKRVVVEGWQKETEKNVEEALLMFQDLGVEQFLATSVVKDGTMEGPDIETLQRLCEKSGKIIAAGGIEKMDDLFALKNI